MTHDCWCAEKPQPGEARLVPETRQAFRRTRRLVRWSAGIGNGRGREQLSSCQREWKQRPACQCPRVTKYHKLGGLEQIEVDSIIVLEAGSLNQDFFCTQSSMKASVTTLLNAALPSCPLTLFLPST